MLAAIQLACGLPSTESFIYAVSPARLTRVNVTCVTA